MNHLSHVTTVRWWHDGNAMIVIPLNQMTYENLGTANFNYTHALDFLEELRKQGLSHASVVDFNYFLIVLASLFNQLTEIYKATNNKERLFASVSLENSAKMVPFIDNGEYLTRIKRDGAPIIEDEVIRIPENLDDRNLIEIKSMEKDKENSDLRNANSILEVIPIFARLFFSVGILNRIDDMTKYSSLYDLSKYIKPK